MEYIIEFKVIELLTLVMAMVIIKLAMVIVL